MKRFFKLEILPKSMRYVVKEGDTLWGIGVAYNKHWTHIAHYNRLTNPHLIHPGQIVYIPRYFWERVQIQWK